VFFYRSNQRYDLSGHKNRGRKRPLKLRVQVKWGSFKQYRWLTFRQGNLRNRQLEKKTPFKRHGPIKARLTLDWTRLKHSYEMRVECKLLLLCMKTRLNLTQTSIRIRHLSSNLYYNTQNNGDVDKYVKLLNGKGHVTLWLKNNSRVQREKLAVSIKYCRHHSYLDMGHIYEKYGYPTRYRACSRVCHRDWQGIMIWISGKP